MAARALALILALPLAGCMPIPSIVREEEYTRDIHQIGVVPAPSAPHAVGPLAPKGAASWAGELSVAAVSSPTWSRAEGAPGNFVADRWGRLRVATGLGEHVEVGVELEASSLGHVSPLATDIEMADVGGVLGRAGPWVRGRGNFQRGFFLEGQLQGSGTLLPYNHVEALTTRVSAYDHGILLWTDSATDVTQTESVLFYWGMRGGMAFGHRSPGGVETAFGVGLEGLPSFYGRDTDQWGCTWYDDGSGECDREPRRRLDTQLTLGTSFTASLAVPLLQSPLHLIGSLSSLHSSSPLGELNLSAAPVPLGGTLGMAWVPRAADPLTGAR